LQQGCSVPPEQIGGDGLARGYINRSRRILRAVSHD
jgi:hypothetical protein